MAGVGLGTLLLQVSELEVRPTQTSRADFVLPWHVCLDELGGTVPGCPLSILQGALCASIHTPTQQAWAPWDLDVLSGRPWRTGPGRGGHRPWEK